MRALLKLPDDYHLVFTPGGGSGAKSIGMNFIIVHSGVLFEYPSRQTVCVTMVGTADRLGTAAMCILQPP